MRRRPNFVEWFYQFWPNSRAKRARVIGEYAALARSQFLLADIALRGGVWAHAHVPGDPYTTAWNDGRAALAKEIIELAQINPSELLALIDRKEQTNAR